MAGILISLLAEQYPEKIQSLIYLSAYLPQNKQSLFDLMADHQQEHGLTPIESALEFSADKRRCTLATADIIPPFLQSMFCRSSTMGTATLPGAGQSATGN